MNKDEEMSANGRQNGTPDPERAGVTIVVDAYRGEKDCFCPHFDGLERPAPMHFDTLPDLVAQCEEWGCSPITVTDAALELHRQDPWLGARPYTDYLPLARAELAKQKAKRELRN